MTHYQTAGEPRRIRIPPGGTIMAIALADSDEVWLLVRPPRGAACLHRVSIDGASRSRLDFAGPGDLPTMRAAEDGSVWLGRGTTLIHVDAAGVVRAISDVPVEPGETIGSFLLVPDGFVVAFHRPFSAQRLPPRGRVARVDDAGAIVWSTILSADNVSYAGVVEMNGESGWTPKPKKPWRPQDWQPARRGEPLLLSNNRLLASFADRRSGLGRLFCLDFTEGRILWAKKPRPDAAVAIVGSGEFLRGVQGYGAFDMYLYDRDGKKQQHWSSNADIVVTETGEILGVEMENCLPSRMHFCVYKRDGTVRKGPRLDGYYTTYPVVNRQGVTVFWRDGKLRAVATAFAEEVLWADPGLAGNRMMTRMLLAPNGTLAFGIEDELFLVPTELGPMATSIWPCGGGNAEGNPAIA